MKKDIPLSYKRALKYLGFTGEPTAEQICMLESAFNNVTKYARPWVCHTFLELKLDKETNLYYVDAPLNLNYKSIQGLLRTKGSDSLCLLFATLGEGVDKHIAKLVEQDSSESAIFDACASSYIEEVADQYQAKLGLANETFRYAPGYGDVPLEFQRELFFCTCSRVRGISERIELDENCIMHPFKSLTGLVGFNACASSSANDVE